MREVISLQVGQCGNQIGSRFWTKIAEEHGFDSTGGLMSVPRERPDVPGDRPPGVPGERPDVPDNRPDVPGDRPDVPGDRPDAAWQVETPRGSSAVYFRETKDGKKFVPRAVLVDAEPSAIANTIKDHAFESFFNPTATITGTDGAGNSWANGYLVAATELGEPAMNAIRAEAEACDSLQGVQLIHALGGGTGSGIGSYLIESVRDCFPEVILCSFSVAPSTVSSVVVEPYNSVLALKTLNEEVDAVNLVDNDALLRLCVDRLGLTHPTFTDFNELVCGVMSGITCSLRYHGQHNGSLRKLVASLIPFPELHMFTLSSAPNGSDAARSFSTETVADLLQCVLSPSSRMLSYQQQSAWQQGLCQQPSSQQQWGSPPSLLSFEKIVAASAIFQGAQVATKEVEDAACIIQEKNRGRFVEFLANCIQTSLCSKAPPRLSRFVSCVVNSSLAGPFLTRIARAAKLLHAQQAYLHWYDNEFVDDSGIRECAELVREVGAKYRALEGQIDQEPHQQQRRRKAESQNSTAPTSRASLLSAAI